MNRFDVTVVGGGVAGLATAIAVQSMGHSVAVIERGNYDRVQIGEVLPPEIKISLTTLSLWEDFLALQFAQTASRLSSWGDERLDEADYINAYGNGWLISRPTFEQMLAKAAVDRGVSLFRNAQLRRFEQDYDRSWRFTLRNETNDHVIHSRFAVVATGRASSVLRNASETRNSYDQLVAVVARLARHTNWPADDHRPLIEATMDGWWFSVLFPDGNIHLAMMTDSDLARVEIHQFGSRAAMLMALLQRAPHTRKRLAGRLDFSASTKVVAANTYINNQLIGDAKLAVGDAALAIDPLAGQGSLAAIDGAVRAAKAISEYFRLGTEALQRYADQEQLRLVHFLADRTAYYRMERRWPRSPFWNRRYELPKLSPARHLNDLEL